MEVEADVLTQEAAGIHVHDEVEVYGLPSEQRWVREFAGL
jgi:hypothetical protein